MRNWENRKEEFRSSNSSAAAEAEAPPTNGFSHAGKFSFLSPSSFSTCPKTVLKNFHYAKEEKFNMYMYAPSPIALSRSLSSPVRSLALSLSATIQFNLNRSAAAASRMHVAHLCVCVWTIEVNAIVAIKKAIHSWNGFFD